MKKKFILSITFLLIFLVAPVPSWSQAKDKTPPHMGLAACAGEDYFISSPDRQSLDIYQSSSQNLLYSLHPSAFINNFSGIDALAVAAGTSNLSAFAVAKKNAATAIYIFDLQIKKLYGVVGPLPNPVNFLAFSPNGRHLALSFATEPGIMIFRVRSNQKNLTGSSKDLTDSEKTALKKLGYLGEELISLNMEINDQNLPANITALTFDRKERLAVASDDGKIRLYDENFKLLKAIESKSGRKPAGLRMSPDDSRILVSYGDTTALDIYRMPDLIYLYSPDTKDFVKTKTSDAVWSADGRQIYAAISDQETAGMTLYKWDTDGQGGRSRLSTLEGQSSRIAPLHGGGLVYTSFADGLNLLDKRYGTLYNEFGNFWVSAGHKYGNVTYEIGGQYKDSDGNEGSYWFPISKLKWPINTVMGEVGGEIHLGKRWEVRGSFARNLTSNLSGKMEDSDWTENPGYRDVYSETDADFWGYVADASVRLWFFERRYSDRSFLSLGIGAGFTYQHYEWEAKDGYQWSSNSLYYNGPLPGLVITYETDLYMPYLELVVKSSLGKLGITGTIGGSPYLWAKDEDNHKLVYKVMRTNAHGYSLKAGLQADYHFTERWFAGLSFNLLCYYAEGTQKSEFYAGTSAGYKYEIEHEIRSVQLNSMLVVGFLF